MRRWRAALAYRPGRWAGALIGLVLAGAAGFGLGWAFKPPTRLNATAYGRQRTEVINGHLQQVRPGFVLLAGDSYAEFLPADALPCDRDIVNAGVSGAKALEYLRILDALAFPGRPSAAFLTLGLNDLLAKHDPGARAGIAGFRDGAGRVMDRLGVGGTKLVVAAVPPVPEHVAHAFGTGSFETYSSVLQELCKARDCTFVDPYGGYRSELFWRARPDAATYGLHLTALRPVLRGVAGALCR